MGAEVIKVEMPSIGDETRYWGPPFIKDNEGNETKESAYFLGVNRNKVSITVDFRKPEGQKILHDLARHSDVVIENFKVGGLAKYHLDYESLRKINPKIVYCSITGYGQTGPRKDHPGYDFVIQGLGGLMSITGEPEGTPMKVGVAVIDVMTGMTAVSGILSALIYRDKSGIGQHVDVSLFDTQLSILANQGMNYLTTGNSPKRLGNEHPNIVPYSTVTAADGYLIISIGNDKQFKDLCTVFGKPQLAENENYKTNKARVAHRVELYKILNEVFLQQERKYWIHHLTLLNVPNAPVNSIAEAFNDDQAIARGAKISMKHPLNDSINLIANPLRMSESQVQYRLPPPLLGEHTTEVLTKLLNLSDVQIEELRNNHVI